MTRFCHGFVTVLLLFMFFPCQILITKMVGVTKIALTPLTVFLNNISIMEVTITQLKLFDLWWLSNKKLVSAYGTYGSFSFRLLIQLSFGGRK